MAYILLTEDSEPELTAASLRKKKHYENKQRRIERLLMKRREIRETIKLHGQDILASDSFRSTKNDVQHGTMSVNGHCKNVATASLTINRTLHLNANKKDLVRGALLHDYFLYDWHDKEATKGKKLHGFAHAAEALSNAERDFSLNDTQKEIIRSHMWPLNITKIPRKKEAWIVTAADKYCSLMETIGIHKGILIKKNVE